MQKDHKLSRRALLAAAGGAIISIGLPGSFIKLSEARQLALASDIRPDGRPRLPPGQVAVERLPDLGGVPGTATISDWSLKIYGEVKKPLVLSYAELLSLEQVDIVCDVHCVTGWTLLDSRWRGVRLATIIDMAGPRHDGSFVILEAAEGYSSNIPMAEARKENVILAHSFFGEKLAQAHGAPVRALIPDRYFYKSAKWLEAVKIRVLDEPGFWETRGFSNSADPWKEERH